jgi:hypothetical protein
MRRQMGETEEDDGGWKGGGALKEGVAVVRRRG